MKRQMHQQGLQAQYIDVHGGRFIIMSGAEIAQK